MVILGLGSNIFDRLANLRRALHLIRQIPQLNVLQVSSVYQSDALLPDNAPASWDIPYFNACLRCETTLKPFELLKHAKMIERAIGRKPELVWGPRLIDIDIIAWDENIFYEDGLHIPHEHLHSRPFALLPLAEVAPFWTYPLEGDFQGQTALEMTRQWGDHPPFHTHTIPHRIDTPIMMGIMNLTPDSFSDGGDIKIPDAERMIQEGAEILDLGAESTGPKATPIDVETEWTRLLPYLTHIQTHAPHWLIKPRISVDTYHPTIAKRALEQFQVDIINDVTGFDDPRMRDVLAESTCEIIFMHHLGVPASRSTWLALNENPVEVVYEWAEKRIALLETSGISRARLIFDPGIGFGKQHQQSLVLLQNINQFKSLGVRLLVGHSRKSFLTQFIAAPPKERDFETAWLSLWLAKQGVDYLRLHNLTMHARLFKLAASLPLT